MGRSGLGALVVLVASSAAAASGEDPGTSWIAGGSETTDHAAIVLLQLEDRTCTGVMVDPAGFWVMTAGSCLSDTLPQDGVLVQSGADGSGPAAGSERWYRHEDLDLGVIALRERLDVPSVLINDEALDSSWNDMELELVGYGATRREGEDGGTRRAMTGTLIEVGDHTLDTWGDGAGLCDGDEGAAVFARSGDVSILVGIGNRGTCGVNRDVHLRVDTALGWLLEHGVPFQTPRNEHPSANLGCATLGADGPDSDALLYTLIGGTVSCWYRGEVRDGDYWDWGDESTTPARSWTPTTHTYDTLGEWQIGFCLDTEETTTCVSRQSIRTCPEPDPTILDVHAVGNDVSATADPLPYCLRSQTWLLLDTDGAEVDRIDDGSDTGMLTAPGPGAYTVVHRLDTEVGEYEDTVEVEVEGDGADPGDGTDAGDDAGDGCGCSSTPGGLGGLILLPLLGLVARRRR